MSYNSNNILPQVRPKGSKYARTRCTSKEQKAKRQTEKSEPYGPVVTIPVRYFGTFAIDVPTQLKWYLRPIKISSRRLINDSFKGFNEYRIKSAIVKVTFAQVKSTFYKPESLSPRGAVTVCSNMQDIESPIHGFMDEPFDAFCSGLSSKVAHLSPYSQVIITHHWRPTEPSDRDWRLTSSGGLCNLLLGYRMDGDHNDIGMTVSATVEIKPLLQFRSTTLSPTSYSINVGCTNNY